ncbi:MAG TPA: sn-glycerol-3-phosphate ABC transporter ATP-binding protein UgpC [Solirubrobacterales bacterium]|nr:sn-glycerol-3-phosphate ABC transporter ATP-binding protein UgpC [Solirubrobacterales bacterium]
MAAIEFRAVTKRYRDGTEAVKAIDLQIADGEFMILVGPSGCGKTTALRMIAGLEDISDGELYIGERLVNDLSPAERDIAMVFQNYALYPHMTVRENMGFALRIARAPKDEVRRRVEEAAELLGLSTHLERKPANLSGGQRQRVAMGRAIVRDPAAFLMDEPLSNLDAKLRTQMRAQIAQLQNRLGTTTVFVTHDQTEAMTLGDRVAVMREGLIQQIGSPQSLYDDPVNLFVAGFIGSPPMNFVPARIDGERIELPFGTAELPAPLRSALAGASEARSLIAGMRPEHIDDAAISADRGHQLRFQARVDLVESMGPELYLHFSALADPVTGEALMGDLPSEGEVTASSDRVIARVSAGTRVAVGAEAELALDLTKISLFDPADGHSLSSTQIAPPAPSRQPTAEAR